MSAVNPLPASDVSSDKRPYEPSMEEILASIRRIIADDQSLPSRPSIRDADQAAFPPILKEPQRPVPPTSLVAPANVVAPPVPMPPEPMPPVQAPPAQMPFERPPLERAPNVPPVQTLELRPTTSEPLRESGMAHGPIAAPQFAMPDRPVADNAQAPQAPAPAAPAPVVTAPPIATRASEPAAPLPPPEQPAEDEPLYDTPIEPIPAGEAPAERPQLFSAATDSAVSAAFNMLAASRLADNSDELMTLAREMIRPLLRTWIDDNLPSMVERMVRAEIERVARGGR